MQKCNDLGLAPTHAIQISGHKKVASTNNYSRLNQQQQISISSAIFNTGKSHTITERPPPSATVTSPVPEVLPAQSIQGNRFSTWTAVKLCGVLPNLTQVFLLTFH